MLSLHTHLRDVDEDQETLHVQKVVLAQVPVHQPALLVHVAHADHALNVRVLWTKHGECSRIFMPQFATIDFLSCHWPVG